MSEMTYFLSSETLNLAPSILLPHLGLVLLLVKSKHITCETIPH